MIDFAKWLLIVATILFAPCGAQTARASSAPADPCSLLPATAVSNAIGQTFGSPKKSVAPSPYANTVQGTDCTYNSSGNSSTLLFRVYFDPSAAEATGLFAKLKMFYSPSTPVPGVGDETYSDRNQALHARKGNVRFYLELDSKSADSSKGAQLRTLAGLVAGEL
jgi:hypothetical protein